MSLPDRTWWEYGCRFHNEMGRIAKPDPKWPTHPELVKVMTVREVSHYLRVHPVTIYRLIKEHKIPAFQIGSDWRFNIEAIDRWMLEQQNPRSEPGRPNTRGV